MLAFVTKYGFAPSGYVTVHGSVLQTHFAHRPHNCGNAGADDIGDLFPACLSIERCELSSYRSAFQLDTSHRSLLCQGGIS